MRGKMWTDAEAAPNSGTTPVGLVTASEVNRPYPGLGRCGSGLLGVSLIENSLELGCWDLALSVTAFGKAGRYQRRE
jgi:hypothetical protein